MDNPIYSRLMRLYVNVERAVMGISNDGDRMVNTLRRQVIGNIAADNINSSMLNNIGAVNYANAVNAPIQTFDDNYIGEFAEDIAQLSEMERELFVGQLNSYFEGSPIVDDVALDNILSSPSVDLAPEVNNSTDVLGNLITGIMSSAALGGSHTNTDIINTVGRARSSATPLSRYSNALGRTLRDSARSAVNQVRLGIISSNENAIEAIQHVSVLDNRTSDICKARAGLTWENNEDRTPIGHTLPFIVPPVHVGCRSTIVPVFRDADDLESRGLIPDSALRSFLGESAEGIDFDSFLESLSAAERRDILGAGRYELYRQGAITSMELVNMSGRPLTLTELRDRYR